MPIYAEPFLSLIGLIPQHGARLFDTTSITSATFVEVHPSPRYVFLTRTATRLSLTHKTPLKFPPEHAQSIHLTTSAYLPTRARRCAPIHEVSAPNIPQKTAVLSAKCDSISVAPFRSGLASRDVTHWTSHSHIACSMQFRGANWDGEGS